MAVQSNSIDKQIEKKPEQDSGVETLKVVFAKPFKFSPNGYDVVEYTPGEAEVTKRCAEVAKLAKVLKK